MQSPVFQTCLLVFLCLVLSFPVGYSQKATFEFFTIANGLAGNDISPPTQDAQGMIWLVTDGKLQKFDGEQFITYPDRPHDLPGADELMVSVTTFLDSLLLIASAHHLFLLNPHLGQWQAFGFDEEYFFHDFKYIRKDMVCFGATKGRVNLDRVIWVFHGNRIKPFPALDGKNFQLKPDWISTGEFIIDKDSTVFYIEDGILRKISHDGTVLRERQLPPPVRNNTVKKLNENRLLVLHHHKFYTLDLDLEDFREHPVTRFLDGSSRGWFMHVLVEDNESFYACGPNDNLIYYDSEQDTMINFKSGIENLDQGIMKVMSIDNTGNLWIQTDRGLLKMSYRKFPFSNFLEGLNFSGEGAGYQFSLRGIHEDEKGTIYTAFYIGLASINKSDRVQMIKNNYKGWVPYDIRVRDDKIYLNNGNLVHIPSNRRLPVSGSTGVGTQDRGVFTEDLEGRLYRIVWDTLYVLDERTEPGAWHPVTGLPIPNPRQNFPEILFYSNSSRAFLVGCRNTLFAYQAETDILTSFTRENWGLPIQRIMAIEEDSAGIFWLGTDIGLVRFNTHTNATNQFTTRDGLCNDFVCGMLAEGDSALWLGTNQGLSRFNLHSRQFVNFFVEDGLTTNEFNRISFHKTRDGRMFFGGLYGLNAFYPHEIMENYRRTNEKANLILTGFEKVDEKQGMNIRKIVFIDQPELHLYHWDRSFEFQYLLTDYTKPEDIQYAYWMEGYEDRWSDYSRDNSIRFSSLPSGHYTFRVKARDHRGLEHPNQLSVSLFVHPPWWKTSWAYALYALIVIGISYTIFRFYKRRWTLQLELQKEHEEAMRLKELDTFKSRLYTNLTHEFRTPLTVILGMTDQMEEDPKQHLREGIGLIRKNGTQLLQLINQLLDLSKLENNVFQLQLVQGNIVPYLRYVCSSFETFARKHQLQLNLHSEEDRVVMDFDPEQIKQVLNNLISNAVKFTPAGGKIDIRVRLEKQDLFVEVEDSGVGIGAVDIGHIFDRFYQADASVSRKWEGSGIGLAHTRELVRLMDGNIEVESNADPAAGPTGTTFMIRLPVRTAGDTPAAALMDIPEVMDDTGELTGIHIQGMENGDRSLPQLLIVEDNPDVVAYLVSCLRNDYQIDVAVNGREGLGKATEGIPDLIISDVMMPEMDGFELCGILKSDERTSHIPIIMLTAKADTSSKIEGLESGADAYLYKPFNKKELLVRIDMMVRKKQQLADYYMRKFKGGLDVDASPAPESADALPIEDAFILRVRDIIKENYANENFALPDLAREIGMSRSQLYRKMKALVDTSPSDFIRNYRLGKAKKLLQEEDLTVSEVAWQVGYKDIGHFSRSYHAAFGENPSEVLRK